MGIRAAEFLTSRASSLPEEEVGAVTQLLCRWEPCKGYFASYRDGIMVTIETSTVIGSLISLIFYSPYLAAGMATTSLVTCCAHGMWRRDARIADLRRLADKIHDDDVALNITTRKTEQVTQQLRIEGEKTKLEGKELAKEDQVLAEVQKQLTRENQSLQEGVRGLQAINALLSSENTKLQSQVNQMQEIIRSLNAHFQEFNRHNEHLKQNIGELTKEVSRMGTSQTALDGIVQKVDKEFAEDIAALTTNITAAQRSGHEIIALLDEKNKHATAEIERMRTYVTQLGQIDRELGLKAQKLANLEREAQARQGEIETLRKDYQTVTQKLEEEQRNLSGLTQQFQQAHQTLSADRSSLGTVQEGFVAVASSLSASGGRLEGLVQNMQRVGAAIDQQIKAVESL